jgi:very-short-patch-repair endonuclease
LHFRAQVPLGPYYADFVSHGARLIIEVDGSQHGGAVEYDAERTTFLEGEGYRVLRFWNNQVLRELDDVLTAIAASHPLPSPPHKGEGLDRQPPVGVR